MSFFKKDKKSYLDRYRSNLWWGLLKYLFVVSVYLIFIYKLPNKTAIEIIAERDNAYIDMICKKSEFGLLIDDLLLVHKYVLLWSDNKIADEFGMNINKYKREFNKALDNLAI